MHHQLLFESIINLKMIISQAAANILHFMLIVILIAIRYVISRDDESESKDFSREGEGISFQLLLYDHNGRKPSSKSQYLCRI